ncbi:MAG: TetR/AcrR family transcriptional regulator, partial [Lachnospiraceae bacterium]|nr:TetR/AcrR family transcriptional regulator [Lachnospiraceae bacterium]
LIISMFAHGYASIIANNSLEYDEELVASHLERAYRGAVLALQEKANP